MGDVDEDGLTENDRARTDTIPIQQHWRAMHRVMKLAAEIREDSEAAEKILGRVTICDGFGNMRGGEHMLEKADYDVLVAVVTSLKSKTYDIR